MALAPYKQAPQSLIDLVTMQFDASNYPSGPPIASQPPNVDMGGLISPEQRTSVLEQLLNPPPAPAMPVDEKPQWGKKLAGSFADAFNNIATIYAGGADLRSNYLRSYLNDVERKNAERKTRYEKQSDQAAAQREKKLNYILSEADRNQMRADALQGKLDLQAATIADREAARKERQGELEADRLARQKEFEAKKSWDLEMEKARYGHERAVAGLRLKRTEGDKAAAEDDKKVGEIMNHIGGMADVLDVALSGGDPSRSIPAMTPAQAETRVRRLIEQAMLGPDAKKVVETYFQKEAGPIIRKHMLDQTNQAAMDAPTSNAVTDQPSTLGSGLGH